LICQTAAVTELVLASRGFRHSAVYHVWNNLPDEIRESKTWDIFKRLKLEIYLCKLAFNIIAA
jgi:uncharacterized membrane protein